MQTSVERIDDTTVKLSVTVEAVQVSAAIDAAAKEMAASVKVPGFRPGRVPRRVLEQRVGKDAIIQEAVRDALPYFYSQALQAEQLQVVGPPQFAVDTFEDGKDANFTATVEVLPEFALPAWQGMQVVHPEWELHDHEVDEQIEAMRDRFAELTTVERPVQVGDFVLLTVVGTMDGEPLEEASGEDLLYQVGDPESSEAALDRALLGATAESTVEFADTLGDDYPPALAGKAVDFAAEVKEVKEKILPALDDEFALTASEFDTLDELRADIAQKMAEQKLQMAQVALRGKVVEVITDLVEVPLPNAMVQQELTYRYNRLGQQAQSAGATSIDEFLAMAGTSATETMENFTDEARKATKAQLVVDAIGRAEGIDVERDDLGRELARQAARVGRPAEEMAEFMLHPDRIGALVQDAFRRKTIDLLLSKVQVVGAPPADDDADTDPDDADTDPDDTDTAER